MGRIMALDYGTKRTGVAVTDPLQIIATGLITVQSHTLRTWLKDYFAREVVDKVVIGLPFSLDGKDTHGTKPVKDFIRLFKKDNPSIPIETIDEQYTSKMAFEAILQSGVKKKDRRDKSLIDEVAATLILQGYLQNRP
jgi:putative Holliday junction resolvase